MKNENIVQKIWNLCHILRGDGISYHQYVSELTYLLFLKIAEENGVERLLPQGSRWKDLVEQPKDGLLGFYQEMLTHLGTSAESETIQAIYAFPTTVFSHEENLHAVIDGIAKIDWNDLGDDRFGQIYEGLIEKSSQDVRSGAGQYFTPRALVNSIVRIMKPQPGEVIQDPASGSGGFLIAADRFVRSEKSKSAYEKRAPKYQGVEIEKNTRRICLMNTFLNGLDAEIIYGDALTDDATGLLPADLILANPPFGSKAGSRRTLRADLPYQNANKQLAFLQHIYLGLKPGGRAAVVLPDNVLSDDGVGRLIRQDLMDKCNLHTVLRLPTGIFASATVKTNVLFFDRGMEKKENTGSVWLYDLRTNMPVFGKTTPLLDDHFSEFEKCFGNDPHGKFQRFDQGETGRFRSFSRQEIADRDDDLLISWLHEDSGDIEDAIEAPEEIAALILSHLQSAMNEIEAVVGELVEAAEVEE
ncbi:MULTISPECIES: N-6 DNA methylase [Thalassospira]|uniref:class I SAM-dependent DNA methyltransferase n=1 Tax=Thalassospira TaxID=168934 RepID=UPI0008DC925E|nr:MULTISPECIES: N-6 DNA methylase [Thalassospira]MCD1594484.1 type I restriction-modification system subunit M [Thalassospira xiamenensis]MDM7978203.1 N-6 DNA methylase [Thalassospira xiamenensis]OHY98986.1 SAM-dependent methyltransferase [Thalassospira sp. MIT1004]|tara:strand:+ start:1025 stop:2440 length:1416 start_codon:yes stop_codon:yes gene_type:complete